MAEQVIWELDHKVQDEDKEKVHNFMVQHGYDKGENDTFKVGDVVQFNTGYDKHLRAEATIKGIDGEDIYVYNDCFWYPIRNSEDRNIVKVKK